MADNSKCIILTPASSVIECECEAAILELTRRGYSFNKMYGCANVDIARALLVSDALQNGFEEIIWIDADIAFDPNSVERLRSHGLPIVCGLYPKKIPTGGIAAVMDDDTDRIVFGEVGGLVPIKWAGTGFLYTHRRVYDDVKRMLDLPDCDSGIDHLITPYFMPFTIPNKNGHHTYLGDDTSFCERARQCGYKVYADTTIRLQHIGKYKYSWEDIEGDRKRYRTAICNFKREASDAKQSS